MINLKKLPIILTLLSFLTTFTSANAEIKVVASIKPIHSLVSYLMDGIGKPDLIVDGYASPHGFAMKPSHAKMLQNADLIFWVGEDLENFLDSTQLMIGFGTFGFLLYLGFTLYDCKYGYTAANGFDAVYGLGLPNFDKMYEYVKAMNEAA